MKKEKLLELIHEAQFSDRSNLSYQEAVRFKNVILDEVIKELNLRTLETIELIEAMK